MLLSSVGKFSLIAAFCAMPLFAAPDVADLVRDIENYAQLPKDKKESLLSDLSRPEWRKLSPGQRTEIQLACFQASHDLIGRNADGKHKIVREGGGKQILKIAGDYLNGLPPEKTPAHPSAGAIYGEIPENAPRITRKISIDPAVVRWQSTGLYAAPGEVLVFTFPEEWVAQGLKVQVSGHRDDISVKKDLMRLPTRPARSFAVDATTIKVASSFGGAIYIDTGAKPRVQETFQVEISNALAAPYFVLGETKVSDWKNTLQQAPAPYAELVSKRIALSFPAEWIRELEDPTALLEYWDKVVALHDELGGMADTRSGPERVNVDIQISVGLFHAGYPAQGPQNQCRGVVELADLQTQGNWGWFHELGHEAQRRPDKAWGWNNPYTFDGSVEVTVNLFSSHAMDRLKMQNRGGWSWTGDADAVAAQAHKALSSEKKYPEMGAGEKLAMYLQLRDQFGWEKIQKVLAGYSTDQDIDPARLPGNDNQEKRDAFLIRMSEASGHNLTAFMQDLWGISMSPEAVEKLQDLPSWIPAGFEKYLES